MLWLALSFGVINASPNGGHTFGNPLFRHFSICAPGKAFLSLLKPPKGLAALHINLPKCSPGAPEFALDSSKWLFNM